MRPLCICKQRPAAINYKKNGKTYYRTKCEVCLRGGVHHGTPKWKQAGYVKKNTCEKCRYTSKHIEQFNVFHIDGDLNNSSLLNLKTVCANCQRIIQKTGEKWKQGDLLPDF